MLVGGIETSYCVVSQYIQKLSALSMYFDQLREKMMKMNKIPKFWTWPHSRGLKNQLEIAGNQGLGWDAQHF
jgi:hypothetical protein